MTTKIKNLVTEAVSLDREISEQTDRLKEIKAQLVEAAREREDELVPTDGGGLRWTAEGSDGCIALVNFPAPSLKSKIDGEASPLRKSSRSRALSSAVSSSRRSPTSRSKTSATRPRRCS